MLVSFLPLLLVLQVVPFASAFGGHKAKPNPYLHHALSKLIGSNATLEQFNFTNNVATHFSATGWSATGFAYPFAAQNVNPYSTAFIAINQATKQLIIDLGAYGSNFFFENVTYVTIWNPQLEAFVCGRANYTWAQQLKALSLLNQKGVRTVADVGPPLSIQKLTRYSGYGSDNTQCSTGISYAYEINERKGVNRIEVDTPLLVDLGAGKTPVVVKQILQFTNNYSYTAPNPNVFTLPASCSAPYAFDWCSEFTDDGLIPLYPLGTF